MTTLVLNHVKFGGISSPTFNPHIEPVIRYSISLIPSMGATKREDRGGREGGREGVGECVWAPYVNKKTINRKRGIKLTQLFTKIFIFHG